MLLPTLKARLVHPSFLSLLNQYLPRTPHLYQVISHLLVLLMQMQRLKSLCLNAPNAAHLSRLSSGKICPMMSLLHLLTDHPIFIAPSQARCIPLPPCILSILFYLFNGNMPLLNSSHPKGEGPYLFHSSYPRV